MKILVVSDSHGYKERLKDIVEANADAEVVIFCGDGERDFNALNEVQSLRNKRVIAVCGNCDTMSFYPRTSFDEIGGHNFYITHGHYQYVKSGYDYIALDAQKNNRDVVCFGHTHVQHYEKRDNLILFNPGAVMNSQYGTIEISDDRSIHFYHWEWRNS